VSIQGFQQPAEPGRQLLWGQPGGSKQRPLNFSALLPRLAQLHLLEEKTVKYFRAKVLIYYLPAHNT